jgi:shikimate dehydrogenase
VVGFNVTVPHKEAVCPLLDEVTKSAASIGAVNTVVNRGGRLAGYNTDAEGFLRALKEEGAFQARGKRALLLGAGGSARAVAFALAQEGAEVLTIANRTLERAQALAQAVKPLLPEVYILPLVGGVLAREAARSHLIVNCTALGMRGGPAEGESPLTAAQIPPTCLVYDLVYNPAVTPLLQEAARAGAQTLGGLPMLVYQGAESFRLWTGREPPLEVMFRAARSAL